MARNNERKNRRITHSQPLNAIHPQPRINHIPLLRVRSHATGRRRVIHRLHALADEGLQLGVRFEMKLVVEVSPREFVVEELSEGFGSRDLEAEADAADEFFYVFFCG